MGWGCFRLQEDSPCFILCTCCHHWGPRLTRTPRSPCSEIRASISIIPKMVSYKICLCVIHFGAWVHRSRGLSNTSTRGRELLHQLLRPAHSLDAVQVLLERKLTGSSGWDEEGGSRRRLGLSGEEASILWLSTFAIWTKIRAE